PVTGQRLLLTGAGGGGFAVYGLDDPAAPQPLYAGALEGAVGWHDQVLIPHLVDGRVLLLLAGETLLGPGDLTGQEGNQLPDAVAVVDLTDPAKPALLGTWRPPMDPRAPWSGYQFSIHEMAATPTGQVAISWYHAGVWVIDVSTQERQAKPVALAAYQPHEALTAFPPATIAYAVPPVPEVPFVWSAGWTRDGHLVVPDMHTGLYVLKPAWGLHPALDSGQ
ncbi:MAG TPA: hypothetical protein VHI93_04020, partial [Candidatus Thermoplasmatota archaeon]|nr:hypothetical protein [Candidatus Thermoplasmatota archaeon]